MTADAADPRLARVEANLSTAKAMAWDNAWAEAYRDDVTFLLALLPARTAFTPTLDVASPNSFSGADRLPARTATTEAEALAALERSRIVKLISDRRDDMRWCNKPDDCHTKADALDTVLADIEYVAALAVAGGGE